MTKRFFSKGTLSRTALLALCALSLTACPSPGKRGELSFNFQANDQLFGVNDIAQTLAVGTHTKVLVYDHNILVHEEGKEMAIKAAKSSDEATLEVTDIGLADVTLKGLAAGTVELEVHSNLGTDAFNVTIADVHEMHLTHRMADTFAVDGSVGVGHVFLAGGASSFQLKLLDPSAEHLIGYFKSPYVTATTGDIKIFTADDTRRVDVNFLTPGTVDLAIDTTKLRTLEIVAPVNVAQLELEAHVSNEAAPVSVVEVGAEAMALLCCSPSSPASVCSSRPWARSAISFACR